MTSHNGNASDHENGDHSDCDRSPPVLFSDHEDDSDMQLDDLFREEVSDDEAVADDGRSRQTLRHRVSSTNGPDRRLGDPGPMPAAAGPSSQRAVGDARRRPGQRQDVTNHGNVNSRQRRKHRKRYRPYKHVTEVHVHCRTARVKNFLVAGARPKDEDSDEDEDADADHE